MEQDYSIFAPNSNRRRTILIVAAVVIALGALGCGLWLYYESTPAFDTVNMYRDHDLSGRSYLYELKSDGWLRITQNGKIDEERLELLDPSDQGKKQVEMTLTQEQMKVINKLVRKLRPLHGYLGGGWIMTRLE